MILDCLVSSNAVMRPWSPLLDLPVLLLAGPPSVEDSSPHWVFAGINWVLDVLLRQCNHDCHLSELTRSLTAAVGVEVVELSLLIVVLSVNHKSQT
jgi:hypothetical protein